MYYFKMEMISSSNANQIKSVSSYVLDALKAKHSKFDLTVAFKIALKKLLSGKIKDSLQRLSRVFFGKVKKKNCDSDLKKLGKIATANPCNNSLQ